MTQVRVGYEGDQLVINQDDLAACVADQIEQSGTSVPLPANATDATTDVVTPDPISGSDTMTEIVVPANCTVLAIKIEGDDFPRWLMAADPGSYGLMFGNGTDDPIEDGAPSITTIANGDGSAGFQVQSSNGYGVVVGGLDARIGPVNKSGPPLMLGTGFGGGATISSDAGAPTIGGNVGDCYINRTGGDGTWLYRCTVAGTAGNATWVAKL